MKNITALSVIGVMFLTCLAAFARACDSCAIYTARHARSTGVGSFQVGVAERFTRFSGKAEEDGVSGATNSQQYMNSAVTQFYFNYRATTDLSFQLTLPYIYRSFRRVSDGTIEKGSLSGIGDLALLVNADFIKKTFNSSSLSSNLYAGLKLPTGDSGRLSEEADSDSEPAGNSPAKSLLPSSFKPFITRHGSAENGSLVGGDDLTPGSGSVDLLIGSNLRYEYQRYFVNTSLQYVLRSEGSYDFRYGNEVSWSVAPGYMIALQHSYSASFLLNLSSESKANDRVNGEKIPLSAHDRIFLGPSIAFTYGLRWYGEAGLQLPIKSPPDSRGVEPDYRVNAVINCRF
ncbi:MAG: hypothetical protein D6719_06725 [Candidatus Dadabacteria bacterium]|nr:MAG: hypothetical protein D6719_06725 [Candidatus Dadabacteria bacterium]